MKSNSVISVYNKKIGLVGIGVVVVRKVANTHLADSTASLVHGYSNCELTTINWNQLR